MSAPQDFFGRAISQYAEDIFADFIAGLFGMLEKGPGLLPEHRIRSMQAAVDRFFNERREARQTLAAEKQANPLTPMVEPWHETPGPDPTVDTYTISADPARGRGIIECRTADGQSATYEVERGGDDPQQNLQWAATMAAQLSLYRGEKSPVIEAPAGTPATVFDEAKARLAAEGGQLHVALGNDYPVAVSESDAPKKIVLPSVSGSPKEEAKPETKNIEHEVQQDDDAFAGIDEKTFAPTVQDEETVEGPEEAHDRAEKQAERPVADAPMPEEHAAPMRDDEEISRQAAGPEAVEQPSQQILEQATDDSDPAAREAARNTPDVEDIDPQVLDKANADAAVHAQAVGNAEDEPTESPEAPAPATQTQDEPVTEENPPAAVEEPPVVKTEDQQEPPEGEKPEAPEPEKPEAATETAETQETPAAEEPHPEEEAPAAELPPEEEAPVVEQSQSEDDALAAEVPAEEEAPASVEEEQAEPVEDAPVEDAPVQEAPVEQPAAAVEAAPEVVEAGVPTTEPTVEAGMPAPDPSIDVSEQPLPPPAPLPPRQRLTQQIGGVS